VQIEFLATGPANSGSWAVDDVELGEAPLAVVSAPDLTPPDLALGANFPNPVVGATRIPIAIPAGGSRVTLDIFDLAGRPVRQLLEGDKPEGWHVVSWDGLDHDGRAVPAGIYFYRVTTASKAFTRKMTVIR
jgi:flagellar hook assembly protein FlgD